MPSLIFGTEFDINVHVRRSYKRLYSFQLMLFNAIEGAPLNVISGLSVKVFPLICLNAQVYSHSLKRKFTLASNSTKSMMDASQCIHLRTARIRAWTFPSLVSSFLCPRNYAKNDHHEDTS